ncbi:MAG: DUF4157 domain-containing protein [Myxococcales bacterium]|nr:DUF4157 domain-containing protein [Myxococcales bacterium]
MDQQLFRTLGIAAELDQDIAPSKGGPGKSSLTSRLTPAPQMVFRVADPETARALGESLSGGGRVRIQREAAGAVGDRDGNGVAGDAEAAVERAATSSGSALPASLQRQFEGSLGADLSSVRVHTGGASAQAAHAVGAKAYTVGQDIHFAAGRYQPEDPFGMHLLAHEVAHTVQQSGGAQRRQHKLEVSTPHDAAEHEADRAADAMVRGEAASVATVAPHALRTVQRDAVRIGATRVEGRETNEAEQILQQGDSSVANSHGGVDLSVAGDVSDTTMLLGMVTDNTMNLRHATMSDPDRKVFHESCAKQNEAVIQALGRFQHHAAATQVDIEMFEAAYNTMQKDFARLQGMMAQFGAFHPDRGKLSIPIDSDGAGRAVTGGATEADKDAAIEGIPGKGVKGGFETRLTAVKDSINAMNEHKTSLPTAAREFSDANRDMLTGRLNVSLGPAKREDDPTTDKDMIEAREVVEKANKELAAATKIVAQIGKEASDGLKALDKLPQVKAFMEGVDHAKELGSAIGGEAFDDVFGDKLAENIAAAITGLGNKVSNAKGIVEALEQKKGNLGIIHHFNEWDDVKTKMASKAKTFATQVKEAGRRRAAVTKAIAELERYQHAHKIKGPKGGDMAVMAAFVANANMFVTQADTAKDMGEDAQKKIADALKHEAKQTNKGVDGKDETTGTGSNWEQAYARQPDPLGGKDDLVPIPGARVRTIDWWACTKGRAGGTDDKPKWGFINRQQSTRLHLNEQTGDNQRLQAVQAKIDTMMGNIWIARGSVASFATQIGNVLGFGGIEQAPMD